MHHDDHEEARDPLLASSFDTLRAEMALHATPRGVEKELMAAFAQQFPPQRWYQRLSRRQWGLAGALGSGMAALMVFMLTLHAPAPSGGGDAMAMVTLDDGGVFFALEPLERIEQEAHPRMVETDVARTELASLGFPIIPDNAGDSVRADVLIGADGAPLALRLSIN